jgi:hypothetical protein
MNEPANNEPPKQDNSNHSVSEYVSQIEPIKKYRQKRKLKSVFLIVILALVLILAGYWFLKKSRQILQLLKLHPAKNN